MPLIMGLITIALISGFWLVILRRLVIKRTRELTERNEMLQQVMGISVLMMTTLFLSKVQPLAFPGLVYRGAGTIQGRARNCKTWHTEQIDYNEGLITTGLTLEKFMSAILLTTSQIPNSFTALAACRV